MREPRQRARFGPLRSDPPPRVRAALGRAGVWTTDRLGTDGGFPNGGLWRMRGQGDPAASVVVKRTGPHHLGDDPVWRGSIDPTHPQWWGREAEFYRSDLAVDGWNPGCRPAACYDIDDHDEVRDLWLEDVTRIPAPRSVYPTVVAALARWQLHHRHTELSWLSRGWIPEHLGRRRLDNEQTLAHPEWDRLIGLGVSPKVRDCVRRRITDPAVGAAVLDDLPQTLTHYDFHHMNLGLADGQVVIIDWATVGWGPIGHDVGFLLIDHAAASGDGVASEWDGLVRTYIAALHDAGGDYDPAVIERSVAVSNVIRFGWAIDYVLSASPGLTDEQVTAFGALLGLLADLQAKHLVSP